MGREEKKTYESRAGAERRRYQVEMEVFREVGGRLEIEKKVEKEVDMEGKEERIQKLEFLGHGEGFGGFGS